MGEENLLTRKFVFFANLNLQKNLQSKIS